MSAMLASWNIKVYTCYTKQLPIYQVSQKLKKQLLYFSFTTATTFSTSLLFMASSSTTPKSLQLQRDLSQRSEEYRQLFGLPVKEVLISDYNCALQENFLLQGHIYLFDHYICFYSNLFGFETKKIIPFHEVSDVRRAKAAGIFPTAIEILAGEKKYFFTSFLSRDEAFKLINEGWSQHGNGTKENTDLPCTKLEHHSQENGDIVIEKASISEHTVDDADLRERQDIPIFEDSKIPEEDDDETVPLSALGVQDLGEGNIDYIVNDTLLPRSCLGWVEENCDAPKVSSLYTKVAESKFPITVEEFFNLFCSDDAVDFLEAYHQSCGDREFKCNSWYPHEEFGHARDVSFQHPIKFYLGAKCGSCKEVQKYRIYQNSHLVMQTYQSVSDVPYGDYFHVEGLMDVEKDSDDSRKSCLVRVYLSVIFTKKTMFKGKITQATIDEGRDSYAIWIKKAHELLKRKKLEVEEAEGCASDSIMKGQVCEEAQPRSGETFEGPKLAVAGDIKTSFLLVGPEDANDPARIPSARNLNNATSHALFRKTTPKSYTSLKSRSRFPIILVIALGSILLLMQLSIVILLSKPQKVQLVPQLGYSRSSIEITAWTEKRIQLFKEEMLMIESMIEEMRHNHQLLKAQLEYLEHFKRLQVE